MKLIEFLGVPGSGKTTLFPILKNYFSNKGFSIYDSRDVILKYFQQSPYLKCFFNMAPHKVGKKLSKELYNFKNVKYFFQVDYIKKNMNIINFIYNLISQRPIPEDHKKLILKWFMNSAGLSEMARQLLDENSYLILDEGFIQKAINIFVSIEESSFNSKDLIKYLGMIPNCNILIKVDTSISQCHQRLIARNLTKRLMGKPEDKVWEFLNKSKTVTDVIIDNYRTKETKVIVISNPSDNGLVENNYDNILQQLNESYC